MVGELVKALRDDMHLLTGSYVLDALSDLEQEDFGRHLQDCPACKAEVRGLRETAARLAMAKALRPPASLQARVLAATYRTRQLPPLPSERTHRKFPCRLAILAAAASVAAAVALGVGELSAQHQLDRARETAISRVVTAPDARVETARASAGGSITVVTSAALREAVVSTTGMAALPSGRAYQVWVMSPSGARSAGLLHGTSLLATIAPGDRIGITVEPAGGAARPTTNPVAILPV